ncbi:MAG TPA: polysaccharide biosynthesis tyrosine autokinase [Candidatus Sulfotelmatobacter sp.]|jgi:succinoglycan biosynthesis transport protein ExoP|nr:polysaccharide biosynthesis tyrosine autokinase [Candidatus Sulfotelmatobacter sp.]
MRASEFPIQRRNGRSTEIDLWNEPRTAVYRHVDSPPPEVGGPANYDSLRDYWQILFRYRKTLLTFVIAGLVGAILISLIQTPIYRVRTSLEIQGISFLEQKGPNDTASNYASPESYVETQVKLLQSESLLEHVIEKLKLQNEQPKTGLRALTWRIHRMFQFSDPSGLPEREKLMREIERNLTVRTSGTSRLLEVTYESPDPKGAADFANTLVSQFIELTQEERWKSAQGTAEWLTSHLDKMKAQLEQSETEMQEYARTSGLSFTSEKENLAESRLKELQDDLSKAQADRIANQAKLEGAKSKPADTLPEVLDDTTMREYRQRLTDLQRQYAELSATLTPEHYKVQRVQAQIDELKVAMQRERGNVVHRIGNEYAAALRRETLLSKARDVQAKVVADQSEKAIHYDTLKRDVDSNRHLYEVMLQRVKEASLASAMRDSNVMVVDRARPPLLPYRPSLPMNSAIGLCSGVLFGFGFVLLRERVNRRISAPGDAQVYLDLPELGVIPLDDSAIPRQISNGLHPRRPAPALRAWKSDCPELATWKRKPSIMAECARTTLTSILLPIENGDGPQVIVITSPCPGDGKTTVACNLSIAVAEIGRKVLLIEGDLRRPRLNSVFGVGNNWGLSDVLRGDGPLENVSVSHLVRETEVAGLYLLPGGSCGVTPSNLFYSPRMSTLLKRLRAEFDMILMDAPPMIHLADARVLGHLSDGVVLVIRAGQTTTESALSACQRFAEDGTRVLGTILNSWDPKTAGAYGYGGYADYHAIARK